jgi:hypothetical protein
MFRFTLFILRNIVLAAGISLFSIKHFLPVLYHLYLKPVLFKILSIAHLLALNPTFFHFHNQFISCFTMYLKIMCCSTFLLKSSSLVISSCDVRSQVHTVVGMKMRALCILPPSSPWWWRQYATLKCWSTSTILHGTISQKAVIFTFLVMFLSLFICCFTVQ